LRNILKSENLFALQSR